MLPQPIPCSRFTLLVLHDILPLSRPPDLDWKKYNFMYVCIWSSYLYLECRKKGVALWLMVFMLLSLSIRKICNILNVCILNMCSNQAWDSILVITKPIPIQFHYKYSQILLPNALYLNAEQTELHRRLFRHQDRRLCK